MNLDDTQPLETGGTLIEGPEATVEETHPTEETGQPEGPEREKKRRWKFPWPPGYLLLWLLTIGSLVFNFVTIRQIVLARQAAQQSIQDAIAILSEFQQSTFEYNFPVEDTLVIETTVPINETIPIPINELIEVRTAAVVTLLDIPGVGPITHTVPVAADVPINEEFTFEINEEFDITAPVDIDFDVPIAIALADTPLYETLGETIARLEALSETLDQPLVPIPSFLRAQETGPADGGSE